MPDTSSFKDWRICINTYTYTKIYNLLSSPAKLFTTFSVSFPYNKYLFGNSSFPILFLKRDSSVLLFTLSQSSYLHLLQTPLQGKISDDSFFLK